MNQFDKIITERQFDEERALYHLQNSWVSKCNFAGPADGESVLKEARNIAVEKCSFFFFFPLWHVKSFSLADSAMDELTRAAIWYADDGEITEQAAWNQGSPGVWSYSPD